MVIKIISEKSLPESRLKHAHTPKSVVWILFNCKYDCEKETEVEKWGEGKKKVRETD